MTVVKKYRAVIWKDMSWPFAARWVVVFKITGVQGFVDDLALRRKTHAEALQSAHGTLRRLNARATKARDWVVDP